MNQHTGWAPEDEAQKEHDGDAPDGGVNHASTIEVIERLIASGRDYAEVEARRQKLRIHLAAATLRTVAWLGGIAIFLLMGILIALPIGAILVLAPYFGPLGATFIVFAIGLALVAFLLMIAQAKFRHVFRRLLGKDGAP